ncbi:outer membrane beta-barrel protein [Flavobacterium sp.]|jgi:hypothetical protein|uniref:outer membrane beta-barrel protein n=1 Tax=Flavobacterium sp. TaxID=239 RepID=UPI0037C0163F
MKKKIILSLVLLVTFNFYSQDPKATNSNKENKYSVSIHYIGNLRNNNFVSDNYNGIAGIDAKYNLYSNADLSIQAGLGLDYFKAREIGYQLDLKNSLMINPNIGIVLEVNKVFKPFFNLGYSFFTSKYNIQQSYINSFDPSDPAFITNLNTVKYNYDSVSINPGFRLFMDKSLYFQTDYKYLPVKTNFNLHLFTVGIGIQF